jgi:putative transposase
MKNNQQTNMRRTVKINLGKLASAFMPTASAYLVAANFVINFGLNNEYTNEFSLHKGTYEAVRTLTNLPSQLTISARSKAYEALASLKKKKSSKPPVMTAPTYRLDARSFSILTDKIFNKKFFSILTLDGRIKLPAKIPDFYQEYFDASKGWKVGSTDLTINKQGYISLHITFSKPLSTFPVNQQPKVVAVDRGINNLLVSSKNKFYSGKDLQNHLIRIDTLRSSLQKKGTQSAKRHLRRLSGVQKRLMADINHCISKKILSEMKAGDTLVLEDLTGVRDSKTRSKKHRTNLNRWSFYQLQTNFIYKAEALCIRVVLIDPKYTSQHCLRCGHTEKANRNGVHFDCRRCHYKTNADLLGSKNILLKFYGAVFSPSRKVGRKPKDGVRGNLLAGKPASKNKSKIPNASKPAKVNKQKALSSI